MSVVVSHPTGNPNVRAVLRALWGSEQLHSFHTSLAVPHGIAGASLWPDAVRQELRRRVFDEIPSDRIRTHPYRELLRIAASRLGVQSLVRHEMGFASVDRVFQDLDAAVAHFLDRPDPEIRVIYSYEDGALLSFRAARKRGIKTIYDLPIAHWRTAWRVLSEERDLRPEWSSTLDGLADSEGKRARKDEEIALADRIVVASAFTKRSLTDEFGDRLAIDVTPYGAPSPSVIEPSRRATGEPLRIFYAGHLRQRKGVAYLFDAIQRVDFPIELRLAGPKPGQTCEALETNLADPRCRWLGAIPHATLLREMTRAHVFVFPSLLEGFGLVILEAMAAGLPVITTPHTAGPDCIAEGVDGFIVPIRQPDDIANRLAVLYDDEPRRYAMATAALAKAVRISWSRYEHQIAELVSRLVGSGCR